MSQSASRSARRSVVWFRRDLRLADHPALAAAVAAGEVLALFVVDPVFEGAGSRRSRFLRDAVGSLNRAIDGSLVVRYGDPAIVVPAVAAEIGAETVFVSRDYSPYGRHRDERVASALAAAGRRLRGVGSPYAVDPGSIVKADGSPYAVFTPFAKRWRQHRWPRPIDAPSAPAWIAADSDDVAQGWVVDTGPPEQAVGSPDESGAIERWEAFCSTALNSYGADRERPDLDGTSRLSAHLRFGVVHPRQLLADLDPTSVDHAAFANELAWRDFYADVLFHQPHSARQNLNHRFDAMPLDTDSDARARFARWCEGRTGFALVDAGMRQLATTGWMHNRVRMVVASFLVKDLHLPWWWGAQHFMAHLADGDLASNAHGWQWAAGSGTDAAPYFRVFNPIAQAERYDPNGEYVARYIPEFGTADYPRPMLDHQAERREALARYEVVRNSR